MLPVNGNESLDAGTVGRWVLRIKRGSEVGRVILSDQDPRCGGRPVTVTDEAHKQKVDDMLQAAKLSKKKIFHQHLVSLHRYIP